MNELILIRGVQGSGKTTFARMMLDAFNAVAPSAVMFAADDHFEKEDGTYAFDPEELARAHTLCLHRSKDAMMRGVPRVIVHNTFGAERELRPYFEAAEEHGYKVTCLVVENRHGNKDVHNVPDEARQRTADRLRGSIKLI